MPWGLCTASVVRFASQSMVPCLSQLVAAEVDWFHKSGNTFSGVLEWGCAEADIDEHPCELRANLQFGRPRHSQELTIRIDCPNVLDPGTCNVEIDEQALGGGFQVRGCGETPSVVPQVASLPVVRITGAGPFARQFVQQSVVDNGDGHQTWAIVMRPLPRPPSAPGWPACYAP